MVSAKLLDGECPLLGQIEESKDVKVHVYHLGGKDASGGFSHIGSDSQGMLDLVLLSQWENSAWKGQFKYDVTACETKVIGGKSKFVVQLNENYNGAFLKDFESKFLQPCRSVRSSYMKDHREEILLCISQGEEKPELVTSATVPANGVLVVANESPVEYGNMFLLPFHIKRASLFWDKKVFGLITKIAVEVNSSSFRISFDYNPGNIQDHMYFQTVYFARLLPVEHFPTCHLYGDLHERGVVISEVVGYPLKCLSFTSRQLKPLVSAVAEICSALHKLGPFSLLVSECGAKMFLFPQVLSMAESNMSAWECAGHFVYNTKFNYDHASEAEINNKLASVSLNYRDFEAFKHLCCTIAIRLGF